MLTRIRSLVAAAAALVAVACAQPVLAQPQSQSERVQVCTFLAKVAGTAAAIVQAGDDTSANSLLKFLHGIPDAWLRDQALGYTAAGADFGQQGADPQLVAQGAFEFCITQREV